MKTVISLVSSVALYLVLRGLFQTYLDSMTPATGPSCLAILGHTTSEEEGRTYIVGSIKNNCDRSFGHVTVLFKLDLAPGAGSSLPEAEAYAYGRDVRRGETRQFKTAMPLAKNTTYRFSAIYVY